MLAVLASIAGAGLAGAVQALLSAGFEGEAMLRERVFVLLAGNLGPGLLTGLLAAARRGGRLPACLAGFGIGLGPWLGGLLGSWTAGLAGGLLLAAALALTARGRQLPRPAALAGGLLALAVPAIALLAFDAHPVPGWLRQEALPPLAPPDTSIPPADGPDYLLIVADTLRADTVLDPAVPTPNLDALRARGLWAAAAAASNNQTLPSHLTLLTGLDVERHGMRSNISAWPTTAQLAAQGCVPLAERFRRGGWRTAAMTSNLLLSRVDRKKGHQDFAEGFETWAWRKVDDAWRPFGEWKAASTWFGWLTEAAGQGANGNKFLRKFFDPDGPHGVRRHFNEGRDTADQALRYLEAFFSDQRPYFLFVHFMDPHAPYIAPDPFGGSLSDPVLLPVADTSREGEYAIRDRLRILLREGAPRDAWEPYARYLQGAYQEEVAWLDSQLGRILDKVREGGRPTVILFTGDHGEMFGEHGWKEHGHTLHEGEVAVPLVLAGPGVPAGQLAGVPELVDVARTLLAHAGLDPAGTDGRDLLARPEPLRPALALMRGGASLREGRWRAHFGVIYGPKPETGQFSLVGRGLFDLEADPAEERDLAAVRPEVMDRLRGVLEERLARDLMPSLAPRAIGRTLRSELVQLGYVGEDEEYRNR